MRRSTIIVLAESTCVSSNRLMFYSILTAASALAMVMGVPVFIGT